jgi:diadenosine tetraphosphatase ApaH/serine/threonine PP2A family protein phosphatase
LKTFVCADIHGNARALQAVLAVYREVHAAEFLFLGDCVGYGAHPDACLDVILNLPRAQLVLGNHEAALLDARERGDLNDIAAEAIGWSERMLGEKYLAAIRRRFTMRHEGARYDAVHASPHHPAEWNYIFSVLEAEQAFVAGAFTLCFFGHTHAPALYAFGDGDAILDEGVPFRLEPGARYIVNPGSVGQSRDGDRRASCCVFDSDTGTVTLRRCEYDVEAEARDIFDAGLPRFLGERLLVGI